MTLGTWITDQPDALDLEDELLDFTADLLGLRVNQPFLATLFAQPSGAWINLKTSIQGLPGMRKQLMELEASGGGTLQVTWLPHPETSDAYCLVLFFMESLGWDHLAVYHRELISAAAATPAAE
jgi:hypothetical protein